MPLIESLLGQQSLHCCVGVIHSPARGFALGRPTWSCKLLLNEFGKSAFAKENNYIIAQEAYNLRCFGAATVSFCAQNLRQGDFVHVISKLIHRPRYINIHQTYFNITDLVVSDQFGSITKVATVSAATPITEQNSTLSAVNSNYTLH